ncbi:hypothetical protein F4813DRAFT_161354 [Daldinia decipiens]|uniref:uncharacterized protein n=1 Tax=Daldinia decipiens TaxID=326647 RepID=UPI0020C3284C|nr:uncharacterized protein F4813DRAFT_161354 [Daldinia decipiens]KAI1655512.1 hypothetical protein F4813DRAFT_161354 [Daldinia decipiens]
MASLFLEPDYIFLRHKADYHMLDLEFAACKSLFWIITDIISRYRPVDRKDVVTFSIVISHIRPAMRAEYVIKNVIFRGIILQITGIPLPPGTWSPLAILFDLLRIIVNCTICLPPGKPPLLTEEDIEWGLRSAYCLPGVGSQQNDVAVHNFHFHCFTASMYALNVMDDPSFFVFAMRDALERGWDSADHCNNFLDSVNQWILQCGKRIYRLIKRGFEPTYKAMYYHGNLYELELEKTYGSHRPTPGLTMHRWEFWKKRVEDTMIFLVDCERPLQVMTQGNLARQIATNMNVIAKFWEAEQRELVKLGNEK